MNKRVLILGSILLIIFVLSSIQIIKDYNLESITGGAISGDFDIEKVNVADPPTLAVLLTTENNKLLSEELLPISQKDGDFLIVSPTTIPARRDDHYLRLEWNRRLMILSLYMKADGGDGTFEVWSENNKKIASGGLTSEFKWYNFDVSEREMSSEIYALFNYGGGSSDIIVDQILGIAYPESGLTKVTGLFTTQIN